VSLADGMSSMRRILSFAAVAMAHFTSGVVKADAVPKVFRMNVEHERTISGICRRPSRKIRLLHTTELVSRRTLRDVLTAEARLTLVKASSPVVDALIRRRRSFQTVLSTDSAVFLFPKRKPLPLVERQ